MAQNPDRTLVAVLAAVLWGQTPATDRHEVAGEVRHPSDPKVSPAWLIAMGEVYVPAAQAILLEVDLRLPPAEPSASDVQTTALVTDLMGALKDALKGLGGESSDR